MSDRSAFKYVQDTYRTGGVYETTYQFSLVNQTIQVNKHNNFTVRFPNIWMNYKLPLVRDAEVYSDWLDNQMQFWQNQLNFAVWCATSGCGVSKYNHLKHKNPMMRSFFRFHAYYQIRRILSEMGCPLPTESSWNAFNNYINLSAFERICNEFDIGINTNFRQKLDEYNGMGLAKFDEDNHSVYKKPKVFKKAVRTGEDLNKINMDNFTAWTSANYWNIVGNGPYNGSAQFYILLEQSFKRQSDTVDTSSDGSPMAAIGSFVCDYGKGFTQAGITRINDSIRTYVWAILGAQSQSRTSIIGKSSAFDAQKQFLTNVETAINSAIDIPESIKRYQDTLGYARSKVDFVVGFDLYMMPSDMDLYIGKINGYNNLLVDASESDTPLVLGYNGDVNDVGDIPPHPVTVQDNTEQDDVPTQDEGGVEVPPTLTHEERKLLLIIGGGAAISSLIWLIR